MIPVVCCFCISNDDDLSSWGLTLEGGGGVVLQPAQYMSAQILSGALAYLMEHAPAQRQELASGQQHMFVSSALLLTCAVLQLRL